MRRKIFIIIVVLHLNPSTSPRDPRPSRLPLILFILNWRNTWWMSSWFVVLLLAPRQRRLCWGWDWRRPEQLLLPRCSAWNYQERLRAETDLGGFLPLLIFPRSPASTERVSQSSLTTPSYFRPCSLEALGVLVLVQRMECILYHVMINY